MIIIENVTPKSCHGCLRDCGARLQKVPYLRLFKLKSFWYFGEMVAYKSEHTASLKLRASPTFKKKGRARLV